MGSVMCVRECHVCERVHECASVSVHGECHVCK